MTAVIPPSAPIAPMSAETPAVHSVTDFHAYPDASGHFGRFGGRFVAETLIGPLEELAALQKKATSPCDRHEGGGCDCGRAKKPRSSH